MEILVQQQYDRLAHIYDQRWQGYITNTLSFLVDWAQIAATERVLDVACGTGELERLLVEQQPEQAITGVDFSEQMLAIARQKFTNHPSVTFQPAAASALPWQQAEFDVVVCANAFHYFNAPAQVLAEMQRVLHPTGRIVILDWCRDFLLCRLCDWGLSRIDPAHQNCYTEAELHDFLQAIGYEVQRSQRVRFGLIWGLMAIEATPPRPY
ncbi:class I SAM-dependent methyltransferase [Halomicronema sp. CCY15110]|uniref:class I SAM-dependent methyltransferase n=1 Tax=Halomicronema sp. CCY15110 TaxID=2767773 RepID=UPI00194F6B55|nr:methyltransferase domain-containing protein [Halomicronema sp. CCY15110]